tara:strand:- start:29 stop:520 length:492 start_codon:yes stop_codon:yes gene_type:complete
MALNPAQQKKKEQILSGFKFWLYLISSVPMGWIAGMRIRSLDESKCVTSVPFKWLTKNPFKSMYFAVQSMAAELSTAVPCLLAVQGHKPSVAFIIVDMKASFIKKATDRVFFTCEDVPNAFKAVEKCISRQVAQTTTFKTIGKMKDGTVVAEFEFTWSFKQRG